MYLKRARNILHKILALFALFLLLGSTVVLAAPDQFHENISDTSQESKFTDYFSYYQKYSSVDRPSIELVKSGNDFSNCEKMDSVYTDIQNENFVTIGEQNAWTEWVFHVDKTGCYSICFDYYPLSGTGKNINFSVMIDGTYPYTELQNISLPKTWIDNMENGTFSKDSFGNDLRPEQSEKPQWMTRCLEDTQGLYDEPYLFYLTQGEHKIRIISQLESFALRTITFTNEKQIQPYAEYSRFYSDESIVSGETIRLEAEKTYDKTDSSIYPVYDHSNPATLPNDPNNIQLNTIGKTNWSQAGQRITWKVNVPKEGLYKIEFRARQNQNQGMDSYRTLYINGKIPFSEAENIIFPYSTKWYIKTFGDKNPYLVYLKNGDLISLKVSPGRISEPLRNVNQAVLELNQLYRKIIVITGTSPDVYQDYSIEKQIPELLPSLLNIKANLKKTVDMITGLISEKGSQASNINQMIEMIDELTLAPNTIPERLSSFKDSIESLGSVLMTLTKQPLELDCIGFCTSDGESLKNSVSLISEFNFGWSKFVNSFINDYNSLGTQLEGKSAVSVWITTGRDQAQILNNLIDNNFTRKTNIPISLSMVDTGNTLIRASIAGKGPDVALMVGKEFPINLAMRGALVNLDQKEFNITDEFKDQFYLSALQPFYFNGSLFALPETQVFDMLFYRTDVFDELKLTPPNNWDDFYNVMSILQNNNLQVGIPEVDKANQGVSAGINTFDKFLFQNGGTYYNQKQDKAIFDSEVAYKAFVKWVELYSKLGLDRDFDFFNRFRSGEMPMGIVPYTMYNQISQAAPELRGLWRMSPIPGTRKPDGTIDRSESASGTGCIMLKSAENRGIENEAIEFMKWWVSSETQAQYGKELETVMGVASRYIPASKVAFQQLNWTREEAEVLNSQWKWTQNVPQIPGNYTVSRSLTNAFRSSIDNKGKIGRELNICLRDINDEIARKRKELHLN